MRPAKISMLALLPLLLAGLAGCGDDAAGSTNGSGSTSSSDSAEDREEQLLRFTECLREHGLDVPDPDSSGRFRIQLRGSEDGPDETTRAAMEACQEFAPMRGGNLDELRNDPEFQDAQLEFAQCMRDHGVDMPDPGENGGGIMIDGKDTPPEQLEAAADACDPILREFLSDGEGK